MTTLAKKQKLKLTKREILLLLAAIHMADSEGGWEWPTLVEGEIEVLYKKLGGTVVMTPDGRTYLKKVLDEYIKSGAQ